MEFGLRFAFVLILLDIKSNKTLSILNPETSSASFFLVCPSQKLIFIGFGCVFIFVAFHFRIYDSIFGETNIKSINKRDSDCPFPSSLVFLFVLPEFLPSPICCPSNVFYEQILGALLLRIYMDLPRQFIPITQGLCYSP